MLATLLIVFREVMEAGLIVGIVLAATKGLPGRGRWVAGGVVAGILGACLVAGFASEIASLFAGTGQELFNATVLLLAVAMLTWHNVWMAGHAREAVGEMRRIGAELAAGRRTMLALTVVVGAAVLREGAEVVLFVYSIAAAGGQSESLMLAGGGLGIVAGAAVTALVYLGLLAIPTGRLFAVTAGLITLLAAGLAAQAVAFLQQADYVQVLLTPVWDTSWLLSQYSLPGRAMHTLVGYVDQPDGAQLIAYAVTVLAMVALMRMVRGGDVGVRRQGASSQA